MLVEKYRIISVLIFAAVWVQMCIGFISDEIIPVGGVVSIDRKSTRLNSSHR